MLAQAQPWIESDITYGMYSGLALLLDVYHSGTPNGHGVIHIPGSGWHAPLGYDAQPLKESSQVEIFARPLAESGYTVFSINHRAAPRFQYPAAVEDAQRAVRYIRYHAAKFGIDPNRIGAVGGSSGGHLVSLLGVLDGRGDAQDPDPVNRESAKVQCVVARAAPIDFHTMAPETGSLDTLASFLGLPKAGRRHPTSLELRRYTEASPITYISSSASPFLLLHGDQDSVVPFAQAEQMQVALKEAGVPTELIRISGGEHGPTFPGAKDPSDYVGAMIQWFDQHLRK
jgi:acetyl esterase/lipase